MSTAPAVPTPPEYYQVTWLEVMTGAQRLEQSFPDDVQALYPLDAGGAVVAAAVSGMAGGMPVLSEPRPWAMIVAAVVNLGSRLDAALRHTDVAWHGQFRALYHHANTPPQLSVGAVQLPQDPWLVFPWEEAERPGADALGRLLRLGGIDTTRPGAVQLLQEGAPWVIEKLAAWAEARLTLADTSGVLLLPTPDDTSRTPPNGTPTSDGPVVVHVDPAAVDLADPAHWSDQDRLLAQEHGLCEYCGAPRSWNGGVLTCVQCVRPASTPE